MAKWTLEPGHTAAQFCVRHMMVTWVRGHFKNVHGSLEFDPDNPTTIVLEATIRTHELWTGEAERDVHLRSADFLDAVRNPTITFTSTAADRVGYYDYKVNGELTIRGIVRPVAVDLSYLGKWKTPYNNARVTRVGFAGTTRISRHDFNVNWNSEMENGGMVVGSDVLITLDVEAILDTELKPLLEEGREEHHE